MGYFCGRLLDVTITNSLERNGGEYKIYYGPSVPFISSLQRIFRPIIYLFVVNIVFVFSIFPPNTQIMKNINYEEGANVFRVSKTDR